MFEKEEEDNIIVIGLLGICFGCALLVCLFGWLVGWLFSYLFGLVWLGLIGLFCWVSVVCLLSWFACLIVLFHLAWLFCFVVVMLA